ncbi:hypothetical protein [Streptomyces sp. NPDC026673]|uniref:hypothetical protein n=1 Tax=Streptomyces sp. NPDC026673 TaxID=3155724 RepID=UPI00340B1480
MANADRGKIVNAVSTRRRLLAGVLLFAAVVAAAYGFGTSRADGSFGTIVVVAVLAGSGAGLLRSGSTVRRRGARTVADRHTDGA